MKNKSITPDSLPQIFARKTNRSVESLKKVLKNRMAVAIEMQSASKMKADKSNYKDLTTYANSLLDNELKPLVDLLKDYKNGASGITAIKHSILVPIRQMATIRRMHRGTSVSNVKYLLYRAFIDEYSKLLKSGVQRSSDKLLLSKVKI